jgi:hypothetical protein
VPNLVALITLALVLLAFCTTLGEAFAASFPILGTVACLMALLTTLKADNLGAINGR